MHYVIETRTNGRKYFTGRPVRANYEAQREAEKQRARGKTVAVHSFSSLLLAEAHVAEHNEKHPITKAA